MVSGSGTTVCTLIILYRLLKDYPVVALHNRYLGKNTLEQPPRRLNSNAVAPIDVDSGGTWIGMNDSGLLLAIINQETQRLPEPGRSRGLLALDTLKDYYTAARGPTGPIHPKNVPNGQLQSARSPGGVARGLGQRHLHLPH